MTNTIFSIQGKRRNGLEVNSLCKSQIKIQIAQNLKTNYFSDNKYIAKKVHS